MQTLLDHFKQDFESFENALNGEKQTEAHALRKSAFSKLVEQGFPGKKSEEYKFTPLTAALEKNFPDISYVESGSTVDKATIEKHFLVDDAINLVLIDGRFVPELSSKAEGFELCSLAEARKKHTEDFNKHFAQYTAKADDPFVAWNTAFATEGIFIKVAKNKAIEKPVMINSFFTDALNHKAGRSRNLIILEQGAQIKLGENYISLGEEKHFTNFVTEVFVGQNARLEFTKVQNENENAYQFTHTQVFQERDSHFTANTITLTGGMIRNNINIALNDENCEAHMYGLYLLKGKTHVDNHTAVDHIKPNSFSNELYKGVLDEKSRGVFNGKIFVRQEAQQTNAFQSNNNILLSENATVNTKPQLEIWADDVKCSHGCTIGQLDEEAIFYLRARAIGEQEAKAMLLYAFANDTLSKITIDPLRDHLNQLLSKRLLHNG